MNAKLLLKTLFLLVVLLLLVMMGIYNRGSVSFSMPFLPKTVSCPAAIMYFSFFAVGFLTSTVLGAGGKGGGGGGSSKPSKSAK